jgi:hypothetical protein
LLSSVGLEDAKVDRAGITNPPTDVLREGALALAKAFGA